nr:hypothetical protein [uncultured Emticicia sp.]
MGYIKEPAGIDFVVESKDWTEAEKEEMRKIIANTKKKKNRQTNTTFLRITSAKV